MIDVEAPSRRRWPPPTSHNLLIGSRCTVLSGQQSKCFRCRKGSGGRVGHIHSNRLPSGTFVINRTNRTCFSVCGQLWTVAKWATALHSCSEWMRLTRPLWWPSMKTTMLITLAFCLTVSTCQPPPPYSVIGKFPFICALPYPGFHL